MYSNLVRKFDTFYFVFKVICTIRPRYTCACIFKCPSLKLYSGALTINNTKDADTNSNNRQYVCHGDWNLLATS